MTEQISLFHQELQEQLIQMAPKLYFGVFVFAVFWIMAVVLDNMMRLIARRTQSPESLMILMGRIARIVLIVIGLISGLGTIGINVSALVASLGLTGFALGFALKDALSNILAGILVLFYRPFQAGDKIKVGTFEGRVKMIDLRYTTLADEDRRILIPNANLFNQPVIIMNGN